jgi:hypothetical protein
LAVSPRVTVVMLRPDTTVWMSFMSLICSLASASPVTASTTWGTSCRLSDRRRAVTTISPSVASSAAAAVASGWAPATVEAEETASRLAPASAMLILFMKTLPFGFIHIFMRSDGHSAVTARRTLMKR